jgi:hypothetical protein
MTESERGHNGRVGSVARRRPLGLLSFGLLTGVLCAGGLGCGGRDGDLDEPVLATDGIGLKRAVVLGDDSLSRVLMLTAASPQELSVTPLPVGENRTQMVPSVDGNGLLVLASGERPRRNADDELPSLTLIDASSAPRVLARYTLPDAFSNITLDPTGRWVVLSGAGDNFVSNPNQLVLIDLTDPDFEPITKTIRSFGAAPERFQFTEPLDVPGGERRFLIVESRQDVTLVDLAALDRPEVTIGLPLTPAGAPGRPVQVVVHAGEAAEPADALLAIQLANDPNLVLVSFTPSDDPGLAFNLTPNLVDVGGPPASLDFVTTDGGLRLAALVPLRNEASLVHPVTTRVERVALPASFDRLRRVTEGLLDGDEAGDVALLWSDQASMVAFWSLGRTNNQAFRSVDVLNLETTVNQLVDVPGDTLGYRKLLVSPDNRFFVLDLRTRQSFPMFASSPGLQLSVAPDGLRAWAFARFSPRFAKVDLTSLEPTSLELERNISQLFDIESEAGGERVLVALHPFGAVAATLLDARSPDTADTRFFPGLLLREP